MERGRPPELPEGKGFVKMEYYIGSLFFWFLKPDRFYFCGGVDCTFPCMPATKFKTTAACEETSHTPSVAGHGEL